MKSKKFPFSWEIIEGDGKRYVEITKNFRVYLPWLGFSWDMEGWAQTRYPKSLSSLLISVNCMPACRMRVMSAA
jgi:hypothetical protein